MYRNFRLYTSSGELIVLVLNLHTGNLTGSYIFQVIDWRCGVITYKSQSGSGMQIEDMKHQLEVCRAGVFTLAYLWNIKTDSPKLLAPLMWENHCNDKFNFNT